MGWDDISIQMESESNESKEMIVDEDETENPPKKARDPKTDDLISKYLMQGNVLIPLTCPDCASPLIKSMKRSPDQYEEYYEAGGFLNLEILTVRRLKAVQRGDMVGCVPYCVSCKAVVVTNQDELAILWEDKHKHLMAEKGAVLLAMNQADYVDRDTTKLVPKSRPTFAETNSQNLLNQSSKRPSVTKQMKNGIVLLSRTEDDSDDDTEKETSEKAHEEELIDTVDNNDEECTSIQKEEVKEPAGLTVNPDEKELSSSRDGSTLVSSNSNEENDIDVTTIPYEKR
jgi:uncharacterized Zn finger protein (UPF0148 family)